ncbi:hypothetical protein MBRA1_003681 [Malassezia brasiliensis]|uniref:NADP-dependent oxidoreductase domain-containing protein n=1 Tax=Malassezia brasiliensis TaxID=1821822 RepID=A0AAF0DZX5_9BASI|nr:hypothetical protein MBRA1_003681 [Malassezia brasiliensis]
MEYVNLGNSGLKVSKVIMGCMTFGSDKWLPWVMNEEESLPIFEHAYKAGINTWDTADVYSNGLSEEIVGKALKKYNIPRERVVIMTKVYFPVNEEDPHSSFAVDDPKINMKGLSRKHILDAVAKSVQRLGTYIDVLQIHRLDRETPKEEIMRALNDVVEQGSVRYIGASSMAAWEFQQLQNIADKHGWHKFISMQNLYNPIYREEEREMIPYCQATGVGLVPWYALAAGLMTRPWNEDSSKRAQTDELMKKIIRNDSTDADGEIVRRVEELSKKKNVSMAQIAIAWQLSHKGVTPILGLNKPERIDEAVAAIKVKLSDEEVEYLNEPYKPKSVRGISG